MNNKVELSSHPDGFIIKQWNKRLKVYFDTPAKCYVIESIILFPHKLNKKEIRKWEKAGTIVIRNQILIHHILFTKKTFSILVTALFKNYLDAKITINFNNRSDK